ncbi:MAG: DNA-binding protein WhiA [Faecalimonas sp.]|nr:DNA-binding protein WhiA [Faecalimonas sp.]
MKQELTFSGKVKEELSRQWNEQMHCQIAEIAAIISMCGKVTIDSRDRYAVKVRTENISVARKCFTLLKKTFNIEAESLVTINKSKGNTTYTVVIKQHEDAMKLLQAARLVDGDGEISEEFSTSRNLIVHKSCCKRAFLRGAFLASGSMSHPEKSYHIEMVCASKVKAEQIQKLINSFGLDAKVILRKNSYVVYLKEGSQIVDLLNIMEAPIALMEMENVRILKEMRNSVNRKVNCETANINKTVSAAAKQAEDIRLIQKEIGLNKLPEGLQEIAELRLTYPDASLKELGEMLTEPLGKSGVNHRLRKLSELAEDIRNK